MKEFSVSRDIKEAFTLPASFYTDDSFFSILKEDIFSNSWQFIGDTSLLDKTNVVPFSLLEEFIDEPLLLTKNDKGIFSCLSNVCTHRGNILVDKACDRKNILCRYHGRRFSLNGDFEFMPEFEKAKNFPTDSDRLPGVNFGLWNQFIFINLNKNAKFNQMVEVLNSRVGFLPFDTFKYDLKRSKNYTVKAHWALYCDNYLEGFHIPFVHQGLNTAIDYGSYETVLFDNGSLQIGYAKEGTKVFDFPHDHCDFGKKVAAYYFWFFPNLMMNFYPWGLSVNLVKPVKKDLSKISFYSYVYDESRIEQSAGAILNQVELEDEEVVESVQKGINSRLYKRGRFSPTREQGVHHFHYLLSKYL